MTDTKEDSICWPEGFMNIGGRSYKWVFDNKKEWVEFTVNKMTEPTGTFKVWKDYCITKINGQKNINCKTGNTDV